MGAKLFNISLAGVDYTAEVSTNDSERFNVVINGNIYTTIVTDITPEDSTDDTE